MLGRPRNKPWSVEDTEKLRLHIERGGSAATAAIKFKRTEQAVRTYARTCGWRFPTIKERRERVAGSPCLPPDS
jgi:hypothetical protein